MNKVGTVNVYTPKEMQEKYSREVAPRVGAILQAIFRKLRVAPQGPVTYTKGVSGVFAKLVVAELRKAGWSAEAVVPPEGKYVWTIRVWAAKT